MFYSLGFPGVALYASQFKITFINLIVGVGAAAQFIRCLKDVALAPSPIDLLPF